MNTSDTFIGFGFSSGDVAPDLSDLDQVLGRIEDVGASHCELNLARYELVVDGRLRADKVALLNRICSARTLRYTVHGALAVNFMDSANIEAHKGVFRAMLELTSAVGASLMVHHPGIVPSQPKAIIEDLHAAERETLRDMGDLAASLGVRIGVETLFVESDDRYTADPFRLADEIEAIDHPNVVGTLDFSHAFIMATQRQIHFNSAVQRFATVANHAHIHDSSGRPRRVKGHSPGEDIAYGMGDLHLPPGQGAIPWLDLVPELPFQPGTVLNVELRRRHFYEMETVAAMMSEIIARASGVR